MRAMSSGASSGDLLARELDDALARRHHAGNGLQQRRLAGAVRPGDEKRFALVERYARALRSAVSWP